MTQPPILSRVFDLCLAHPVKQTAEALQVLKLKVIELSDASRPFNQRRENKPAFFLWRSPASPEMQYAFEIAVALLASYCGDLGSMRVVGNALLKFARENPTTTTQYVKRGQEWIRLSKKPDLGPIHANAEFPAYEAIKVQFYPFFEEGGLAALDDPELTVIPEEPEEPEIYTTLGMKVSCIDARIPGLEILQQEIPLALAPLAEGVRRDLLAEFPHMVDAIDLVANGLEAAHDQGDSVFYLKPMLLVGEPGCGKTRFCHRVAELAGVASRTMSFAGAGDARLLVGTARGWTNAAPSFPLLTIIQTATANPVIVIDELEKAQRGNAASNGGDVQSAVLNLWEEETARQYLDIYASAPVDLSRVTWLATANSLEGLSAALLNRVTVVKVPNPGPEHFDALVASLTLDLPGDLEEEAIDFLRVEFAKGWMSVRVLKRAIEAALARKPRPNKSFDLN